MVAEFKCSKCGLTVPLEQYEKNKFCPKCGTFLRAKRIRIDRTKAPEHTPLEIMREDVNVESLFYEFLHTRPINAGGGKIFKDVDSWIIARKQAYINYREKFSPEKLHDLGGVVKDYEDWLLFRNNLSWTTLHRTGYYASKKPERLADLLFLLQNEEIDIAERVYQGLRGKNKVYGIGQGILTGLLHTFFNEKYGVWNSRTKDTLEILRRTPIHYAYHLHVGERYYKVNKELQNLVSELNTDLTSIDGFMWYISKFIRFL